MAVDYKQVYRAIHDYTLALRAICRTLDSQDCQIAFDKMSASQRKHFMELARTGDVNNLRNLIHVTLAADDIALMSYQRLRERASRLRIPKFNKMHKSDLIQHIRVTEDVLRKKIQGLPKPKIGFIAGDGI